MEPPPGYAAYELTHPAPNTNRKDGRRPSAPVSSPGGGRPDLRATRHRHRGRAALGVTGRPQPQTPTTTPNDPNHSVPERS